MMKVLIITNMFPTEKMPYYGIFVKEQVDSLISKGVKAEVFFVNGKESRWNYFAGLFSLAKKLRNKQYDLIHLHHTYCAFLLWACRFFLKKKIPVVLTFHEGEIHIKDQSINHNIDFIKKLVFSKFLKKIALSTIDFVIFVEKNMIRKLSFNGKSSVIPCGVDLTLFRPMEKELCRNRLKISLEKKVIFFPASPMNKNKGIYILKEAINILGRDDVCILTAGNISHEEMPFYMAAADVVVQLSDFEASPMVLKEAMATNVPVIFCDVGDAKSTIQDTEGCFISLRTHHDVASKLMDAFSCNGKSKGRERIVEAGLSLPEVANKIVNVYCHLTGLNLTH